MILLIYPVSYPRIYALKLTLIMVRAPRYRRRLCIWAHDLGADVLPFGCSCGEAQAPLVS